MDESSQAAAVLFPAWGVANSGLPFAGAAVTGRRVLGDEVFSVTVAHGELAAEFRRPAAVAVSYHPGALVDSGSGAQSVGHRTAWKTFGPLHMAAQMMGRFAAVMGRRNGFSVQQARRLQPDTLWKVCKIGSGLLDVDGRAVPALAFDLIGLSGATVIVSADVLTHPVAVAGWDCDLAPYPRLVTHLWNGDQRVSPAS